MSEGDAFSLIEDEGADQLEETPAATDKLEDLVEETNRTKARRKEVGAQALVVSQLCKELARSGDRLSEAGEEQTLHEAATRDATSLLSHLESTRRLLDQQIDTLRERQKHAVDKYGTKREPLELTEEEQELAYELKAASMRDMLAQTKELKREIAFTNKLEQQKVSPYFDSTLSKSSLVQLNKSYKKQLSQVTARLTEVETEAKSLRASRPVTTESALPGATAAQKKSEGETQKRSEGEAGLGRPTTGRNLLSVRETEYRKALEEKSKENERWKKEAVTAARALEKLQHELVGRSQTRDHLLAAVEKERRRAGALQRELTRAASREVEGRRGQIRTKGSPWSAQA